VVEESRLATCLALTALVLGALAGCRGRGDARFGESGR
jgi:hypothetical protein